MCLRRVAPACLGACLVAVGGLKQRAADTIRLEPYGGQSFRQRAGESALATGDEPCDDDERR